MPRRLFWVLLFAVSPLVPLSAQALRVPYDSFRLANGLQVLVAPDHAVPVVTVNIWYHVGSSDEKPGRTGFAHLFEHIMFMGSQHVPTGEFDKLLEAAGGDNNGSTTEDPTNYYEDAPSNALPPMLWLDSDRMGFLLPEITADRVDPPPRGSWWSATVARAPADRRWRVPRRRRCGSGRTCTPVSRTASRCRACTMCGTR